MRVVQIPRLFAVFFAILLLISFLVGISLAFKGAQAAAVVTTTTPAPSGVRSISPTPTLVAQDASANMTGIIILGILLVAIIAIGLLWGGRVTHK
jgi:hypothetical protein